MTKIKFCGLTRAEDIAATSELCPAYVGFVFAKQSRRFITFTQAQELRRLLLPSIKSVGVFVDEDIEKVAATAAAGIIDAAQLHGHESEAYIAALKKRTGERLPIIRAFRVQTAADVARARESTADIVLLDAGSGDGVTFDWSLIDALRRPYFLAGGLSPANVGDAIRRLEPYGVDVSSGIETDGRKDREKMKAFMTAVKGAQK